MNAQEIYNKVRDHLLAQGARATRTREAGLSTFGEQCRYRADDGKKCAAGCLIADEHYNEGLEGGTADEPRVRNALRASGVDTDAHLGLICALQSVHDLYEDVDLWPQELAKVAERFDLTP